MVVKVYWLRGVHYRLKNKCPAGCRCAQDKEPRWKVKRRQGGQNTCVRVLHSVLVSIETLYSISLHRFVIEFTEQWEIYFIGIDLFHRVIFHSGLKSTKGHPYQDDNITLYFLDFTFLVFLSKSKGDTKKRGISDPISKTSPVLE